MVTYEDDDVIEAPRAVIWKLLTEHLDDAKIVEIHPLVRSQKTLSHTERETVVERVIDVNRKPKVSRWKLTHEPPGRFRWEILESEGPWTPGDYLELTYSEDGKRTRIHARGELTIQDLPFFLTQPRTIRRVLDDLHTEDVFWLRRYRY
jgi:hypothetical protein